MKTGKNLGQEKDRLKGTVKEKSRGKTKQAELQGSATIHTSSYSAMKTKTSVLHQSLSTTASESKSIHHLPLKCWSLQKQITYKFLINSRAEVHAAALKIPTSGVNHISIQMLPVSPNSQIIFFFL